MGILNTRIVLRNDSTTNWATAVENAGEDGLVLLKGEIGIEFTTKGPKMKVGDGTTKWEELAYFGGEDARVFEATVEGSESHIDALNRVTEGHTLNTHDVGIVADLIADGKYQHTAYRYNGTAWAAMDGNYNAKNVYFDEDLVLTQSFGKYTTSTSVPNVTVNATGMSMYDLIMDAYSEKKDPTKTNPSVTTFDVTGNGASLTSFEVGTTVTPQWKSTFNAGTYTYKSSVSNTTITPVSGTGVSATAWTIKQGDAVIGSVEDGTATSSFVIGDGNNTAVSGTVTYSVTADYSNGNYALTNLNTLPSSEVRIAAGTTTAKTDTLTFVRKMFGAGTSEATVDSAIIRGMTSATATAVTSTAPFEFRAVAGDTKVVFAYPKALTTKTPKFEIFTMAWGETSGFESSEVEVADARGTNEDGTLNNAMTYTVWTYTPAGAFAAAETKYRAYF